MSDTLGITDLVTPPVEAPVPQPVAPVFAGLRPPRDITSVQEEYNQWLQAHPVGPPVDLGTFAKGADEREGHNDRAVAYPENQSTQAVAQFYNQGVDSALDITRLPQLGKFIGGELGADVGSLINKEDRLKQIGEQFGQNFPRAMAPLLAGPAAPAFMTADSMAQRYGETGDIGKTALAGVLTAGTLGTAHLGGKLGEDFVSNQLLKMIQPATNEAGQAINRGVANEMLSGILPKVGRDVGAVTGATVGTEIGRQVQNPGEDPFTAENVFSTGLNALSMAIPDIVSGLRGSSNKRATQKLADWANEQARKYYKDTQNVTPDQPFQKLLEESVSSNDINPEWKAGLITQGIKDLSQVTDPEERQAAALNLADRYIASRDIDGMSDAAEKNASMVMARPPLDIVSFAAFVKRSNTIQNDVLTKMDELSSQQGTISVAAYRQLKDLGFVKDEFSMDRLQQLLDEGIMRSFSGSFAAGYQHLIQVIANRQIILAEAAKQARGEQLTQESIEANPLNPKAMEERVVLADFFDQVAKIPESPMEPGEDERSLGRRLQDRFNAHSEEDQVSDSGKSTAYAEKVSEIIKKLTEGKTPEELASLDWLNTPVTITDRIRRDYTEEDAQADIAKGYQPKQVGKEFIDTVIRPTQLGNWVKKRSNGAWVERVDKRSNRNQKEVLIRDDTVVPEPKSAPLPPTGFELTEGMREPEQPPSDWEQMVKTAKDHLDTVSNDEIYNGILGPVYMRHGGKQPREERRVFLRNNAKDFVQAILELGNRAGANAGQARPVGEAGKRLLQILTTPANSKLPEYNRLSDWIDDKLTGSGLEPNRMRQDIIKELVKAAGGAPETQNAFTLLPFSSWPNLNQGPKGRAPRVGASNTDDMRADAYRTLRQIFLNMGGTPEEVRKFTIMGMQVLENYGTAKNLQITLQDPQLSYLNPSAPEYRNTKMGGVHTYWKDTKEGIISLAGHHKPGDAVPFNFAAFDIISTFHHELIHNVQQTISQAPAFVQGVYTPEREQAFRSLNVAANTYTPEQKLWFINASIDLIFPKGTQIDPNTGKVWGPLAGVQKYGAGLFSSSTPAEFITVFCQNIGLGMILGSQGKPITPEKIFEHLPDEQTLVAKCVVRDLSDLVSAVKTAILKGYGPAASLPKADLKFYAEGMEALIKCCGRLSKSMEPAESLARATQLVTALEGINWSGPIQTYNPYATPAPSINLDLDPVKIQAAQKEIGEMQMALFGAPTSAAVPSTIPPGTTGIVPPTQAQLPLPGATPLMGQVNLSFYWKYLALFQQSLDHLTKRGITLGDDVATATRELVPSENRLIMGIWAPFLSQDGKSFDPNHPLVQLMMDSKSMQGRQDRAMANKILDWQQRNSENAIERDQNGLLVLTQKAQTALALTPNQRVIGTVLGMQQVQETTAAVLLNSRITATSMRVAHLIMAAYPQQMGSINYDRAQKAAFDIVQGKLFNNQQVYVRGYGSIPQPVRTVVDTFLGGADGPLDILTKLQTTLQNRSWWANEQRPGAYTVVAKDSSGEAHSDGADSEFQAKQIRQRLIDRGFTEVSIISKREKRASEVFDSPSSTLNDTIEREQAAFEKYLVSNPNQLSQTQLNVLRNFAPRFGAASSKELDVRGTGKFLMARKGVKSAMGLDYFDNLRDYVPRLASTVARQALEGQIHLILADWRLDDQQEFRSFVRDNVRQMLTPTSDFERSAKAFSVSYFLACHLSSMIVIGTHAMNTLPESLIAHATKEYGILDAAADAKKAFGDIINNFGPKNQLRNGMIYRSVLGKIATNQPLTPEEMRIYLYQRGIASKVLDTGLFSVVFEDTDMKNLAAKLFTRGGEFSVGPAAMANDALYRLARVAMFLPRIVSSCNNTIAFLAGANQAIRLGMSVEDAYRHADKIRSIALFAGGKTNTPGWIGTVSDRHVPLARTTHTLQQFGFGMVGRMADNLTNSIENDPHLTPLQKKQARKATGVLFTTILAMSGIMGVSGVAALMAMAEKWFGVPLEGSVRRGLAHLAFAGVDGPHDTTGFRGLLTETAMNGIPNQLFGVDIGPRLGVQDFLGTSSYDGFNLADLAGPAASITTNAFKGLGYLAQGEPQKAATTLAPNFLKRPIDMAWNRMKYGDFAFRDPKGQKIMDSTQGELLRYTLGMRPNRLSESQTAARLIAAESVQYDKQQERIKTNAALQWNLGNHEPAMQLAQEELQQHPERLMGSSKQAMTEIMKPLQSVADKGVKLNNIPDPLASVPLGASAVARATAETFPSRDVPRRSEIDQLQQRTGSGVQSGSPKGQLKQMDRAMYLDALVKQGMTRAEAEQQVQMMGLK